MRCRHRRKMRIENLEHGWHSGYQIMCAECLLTTDKWPKPTMAWMDWLRMIRLNKAVEEIVTG